MSNYQISFRVIDLELDVEPSLVHCRRSACIAQRPVQRPAAPRCAVERSDEYLFTGGRRGLPWAYSRVSKQAGAFRDHSTFRTSLFKKQKPKT